MKLLWISNTAPPCAMAWCSIQDTPSLVALALQQQEHPSFDAVILDCRQGCPYSAAHILSASAFLRTASIRLCLFGGGLPIKTDAWLLHCDGSVEFLLDSLQRLPQKSTPPVPQKPEKTKAAKPIHKPKGTMLIVEVFGSQMRIGCTTQCLQLFHYFTTLGFAPAIITTQEQRTLLQRLMGGKSTGDAVMIDGIPFLTSVHSGYDCFIRDGGCIDKEKADRAQNADLCVLVAGVKPWELSYTANALALLREAPRLTVIGSFGGRESGKVLQTLMQKLGRSCPTVAAPWQPSPFISTAGGCYEVLRPLIERMILEES